MKNRVFIVTIDGWGTNLLGTYGISLCETPALDDFAAHAVVFDRYLSCASDVRVVLQSISDGLHPSLSIQNPEQSASDLQGWISTTKRRSIFITDCRNVSETAWADRFTESILIDVSTDEADPMDEAEGVQDRQTVDQEVDQDAWMDTKLAQFVGEALVELSDRQNDEEGLPDCVWIHLSGLTSCWDAPYEYRLSLCDEDDPRPSFSREPIHFEVTKSTDLDEVFQAMCAAAGQARLIDHLWSWIDAFIEQLPDRDQLAVVVAGTRGYPLGEHACVGLQEMTTNDENAADLGAPYAELVHVPLIIQPGFMPLGYRNRRITPSTAVRRFIEDWLSGLEVSRSPTELQMLGPGLETQEISILDDLNAEYESCWIESESCDSIYTQYWAAIFDPASGEVAELYLMPDDRWQQNDVANRASEIAGGMIDLRSQWLQWKITSLQQPCDKVIMPVPIDCLRQPV